MAQIRKLDGRRYSVLGGARSGQAVARLLAQHGATVFVSEKARAETMAAVAEDLQRLGVVYEFGENTRRVLDAETVVLSPGVPTDHPLVQQAIAQGLTVVSELEVASWFCAAPIVAITGTNGKTTTTTLIGRILSDARIPVVVAGNIGTAFSQVVGETTIDGVAVVEVSSFQLDFIRTFRPRVAALLNITPDHLDRYEHSFKKYVAAKQRVFENQSAGDVLIYNDDDEVTRDCVREHAPPGVELLPFSTRRVLEQGAYAEGGLLMMARGGERRTLIGLEAISIRGEHNQANAMAAALTASVLGVASPSVRATLRNFKGVEHRLEFVRELDAVDYVNDSKATNVDSVWYALRSFHKPLIVLMGGRDKGNDYTRLLEPVRTHVKAIVAIGESAGTVERAFHEVCPVVLAQTMEGAVTAARGLAAPGDVVLLSPACASFDWFDNYEHRGRVFKEIVMSMKSSV